MNRAWYARSIAEFLSTREDEILGTLSRRSEFEVSTAQSAAWGSQIRILKHVLASHAGEIYLEFSIPRMGSRIDALLIIGPVLFVLEFKVGQSSFLASDLDQVVDYALDLHNFHEGSHGVVIAPVLVCTEAPSAARFVPRVIPPDLLLTTSHTNAGDLPEVLEQVLHLATTESIPIDRWEASGYKPTPTIIEATVALYRGHKVADISRNDAEATNLSHTASTISELVASTRQRSEKAICFVTGVPGSGKTLVGLEAATKHLDPKDDLYSVFLSGNGPLVRILQEALARDQIERQKATGGKLRKGVARSTVKAFVQNVHHFRDDCFKTSAAPVEHVAIFDEAQRAWTLEKTVDFMRRKKGVAGFDQSEPEFLISCLDRHRDWAVVICLVGGGQEINTGEAGIGAWLEAIQRSFPHWKTYISSRLLDGEYAARSEIDALKSRGTLEFRPDLHLSTSIRSFRSEKVSQLVKELLDLEIEVARDTLRRIGTRYPIVLTRDLAAAKRWLRDRARGSERYGIVVSSQAERLKPHALDVKTPVDPVHWFLGEKADVRSSYYLEDVATEFHVQGLELDYACVVWDADFRHVGSGWQHWSFRGSRWQRIRAEDRQRFLKNAYRVLLTRARQGMVIVVPPGDRADPTRLPEFYDATYQYLQASGLQGL